MISSGQFPTPPTPNPIPLSEDQESQIAAGFVSAQLALLDAISREAKSESFEASRNISRLTQALNGLRFAAGQLPGGGMPFPPWFGFPHSDDIDIEP